ncbi:hypothetical protein [Amycolatopsis sp. NPDC050768]|uniref:hypothetical protein n=1 Tax=Amycolatopsis sp. NPDC050768 TaxID=3154839 RepID=UPI0033F95E8B
MIDTAENNSQPALKRGTDSRERAGFFNGRGPTASAVRAVIAAEGFNPPPDPSTLVVLPAGRRMLEASTVEEFNEAVDTLVPVWAAAGLGGAPEHADPDALRALTDVAPRGDDRCDLRLHWHGYTFDEGRVLYHAPDRYGVTNGGLWHIVTLSAERRPRVSLSPVDRVYGSLYADTAALDLQALAVWIVNDATRLSRTPTSAVWAQARYAAVANTARDEICLYIYNLDNEADNSPNPAPRDLQAYEEILAAAAALDWTNPHDRDDRRFRLLPRVVAPDLVADLLLEGRGPGTVTTVAETHAFWD